MTEADPHLGFVIKEKVEENFSIKRLNLSGQRPYRIPQKSIVSSGSEKQVYRIRDRYWKAIEVELLQRDSEYITVTSEELAPGDSIAISGVGFLKMIEQSLFGPESEGHVH